MESRFQTNGHYFVMISIAVEKSFAIVSELIGVDLKRDKNLTKRLVFEKFKNTLKNDKH